MPMMLLVQRRASFAHKMVKTARGGALLVRAWLGLHYQNKKNAEPEGNE
jgi:hypothetical protein